MTLILPTLWQHGRDEEENHLRAEGDLNSARHLLQASGSMSRVSGANVGAFIVRIGLWCLRYYRQNKEPPAPHSNSEGPCVRSLCPVPRVLSLEGLGRMA